MNRATTYRVTRDRTSCVFSQENPPVLEVGPGDDVTFETLDASGNRIRTVEDGVTYFPPAQQLNPVTGPVVVRGAQPGDTLIVDILGIQLGPYGYTRIKPGVGVIIDELKPPAARIILVEGDTILFSPTLRFPVRPMVGTIGVAPAGPAIASFYPGPYGGNLDINEVAVGARLYLPIEVEGALLSLGDVHARMGDGELTGIGLDISADVTVRVDRLRGRRWERPWLETRDYWVTCANAPGLQEAIRLATSDMATLLAEKLSISREDGFMLIGTCGDARPGQAADIKGVDATARIVVPKMG